MRLIYEHCVLGARPRRDGSGLVLPERSVGPVEAEPVGPFQRVRYRHAGDEGVSLPRADESIAASLPKAQDGDSVKGELPLVQERTPLGPRNVKRRANKRH